MGSKAGAVPILSVPFNLLPGNGVGTGGEVENERHAGLRVSRNLDEGAEHLPAARPSGCPDGL